MSGHRLLWLRKSPSAPFLRLAVMSCKLANGKARIALRHLFEPVREMHERMFGGCSNGSTPHCRLRIVAEPPQPHAGFQIRATAKGVDGLEPNACARIGERPPESNLVFA